MKIRIFCLLVGLVVFGGCANKSSTINVEPNTSFDTPFTDSDSEDEDTYTTIETENGTFSVPILSGWKELEPTELNDDADISLENEQNLMYVAVLSESSEDFTDFNSFNEAINPQDFLDVVDQSEELIDTVYWNGTRYYLTANVDGLKFFYIYDVVQSENGHYVQKIAWTSNSKKEKNRNEMQQVLDSIQDVSNS